MRARAEVAAEALGPGGGETTKPPKFLGGIATVSPQGLPRSEGAFLEKRPTMGPLEAPGAGVKVKRAFPRPVLRSRASWARKQVQTLIHGRCGEGGGFGHVRLLCGWEPDGRGQAVSEAPVWPSRPFSDLAPLACVGGFVISAFSKT